MPGRLARMFAAWQRANVLRMAAALAYYTAFSLGPVLVIALWIGAMVIDGGRLEQHLIGQLSAVFSAQSAQWVGAMLAKTRETEGGFAALVALGLLAIGATTALAELKDGLDEIFGRGAARDGALGALLRTRAYALGLIMTLGFLLIVSLFVNATFAALAEWSLGYLDIGAVLAARVVSEATTFLGTAGLFAAVYAWLPGRRIGRAAIVRATLLSTTLFTLGRWAIGALLAASDPVSAFGAAGAFAVILLWVYYSAAVFYTSAVVVATALAPDRSGPSSGRDIPVAMGPAADAPVPAKVPTAARLG